MKKLSRNEMKILMGGDAPIIGGDGCIAQYDNGCRVSGPATEDEKCCAGFTCQMNASNTATICV